MQATHIANPVRVQAVRILEVTDITDLSDGKGATHPDLFLNLEGGGTFVADSTMTSRYVPVPGDYLVTQEDGYVYLNPKDVFERKYSELPAAAPSGLAPHQQRVLDEKADLDDKLVKLTDFMVRSPLFADVPMTERARLARQHTAMMEYNLVLGERIACFGSYA